MKHELSKWLAEIAPKPKEDRSDIKKVQHASA